VADTKLARRLKVPTLLQMAAYGEHLRRIQGVPPVALKVVSGDGVLHPFPFTDVEPYARRVSARLAEFVTRRPATVAQPVPHCEQCRWIIDCDRGWRQADHLSFVAFLTTAHREKLEQAGITTLAQLAATDPQRLPRSIGLATHARLVRQACATATRA
jgi:predicted RecB family nuclease